MSAKPSLLRRAVEETNMRRAIVTGKIRFSKMTSKQRIFLMHLWGNACKAQGWKNTEELRHAHYAQVLGRPKRFSDFTQSDFDRVKAHFLMLADDVQGTVETDRADIGHGRRVHWRIENRLIPCLGLYMPEPEAYILEIMRGKFHAVPGVRSINDLLTYPTHPDGTPELDQLLMTLGARLKALREEHGDTERLMLVKAGIAKPRTAEEKEIAERYSPF